MSASEAGRDRNSATGNWQGSILKVTEDENREAVISEKKYQQSSQYP